MFAIKGSVDAELKRFKSLVVSEPGKSKEIYASGEKLIVLAGKGEFAQFKKHTAGLDPNNILAYFSAKALTASLIGGHLMLSTYILDNGYPLNLTIGLPNILHDCLRDLSDYQCASIVRLFVTKGYDVNNQENETWLAPLHIATSRGLVDTVRELINANADVNIVGANDAMPLSLAYNLSADSSERGLIVEALTQRGARATWRKSSTATAGGASSGAGGVMFDTSPWASNTQVSTGPSSCVINTAPAVTANSGSQRVRFNGTQLGDLHTQQQQSGRTGMVRFNGASMELHPVPAVPTTKRTRETITGASEGALPPVPPKVSVSTASGDRLLPPPRVQTMESGAGNTNIGQQHGRNTSEVVVVEHTEEVQEVEEEKGEELSARQGMLDLQIAETVTESNRDSNVPLSAIIGSFQMSDDGSAMLFSTG